MAQEVGRGRAEAKPSRMSRWAWVAAFWPPIAWFLVHLERLGQEPISDSLYKDAPTLLGTIALVAAPLGPVLGVVLIIGGIRRRCPWYAVAGFWSVLAGAWWLPFFLPPWLIVHLPPWLDRYYMVPVYW